MKNITQYVSEGNIRNLERMYRNFLDAIKIHDINIKPEEITVTSTPKGNWAVLQNGKKICIVSGTLLTDDVIKEFNLLDPSINKENNVKESKVTSIDNINGKTPKELNKGVAEKLEEDMFKSLNVFLKKLNYKEDITIKMQKVTEKNDYLCLKVKFFSSTEKCDEFLSHIYKTGKLASSEESFTAYIIDNKLDVDVPYMTFRLYGIFKPLVYDSDTFVDFYIQPKNSESNYITYDVENNTWFEGKNK